MNEQYITVQQLHDFLSKLISEGKGHLVVLATPGRYVGYSNIRYMNVERRDSDDEENFYVQLGEEYVNLEVRF